MILNDYLITVGQMQQSDELLSSYKNEILFKHSEKVKMNSNK